MKRSYLILTLILMVLVGLQMAGPVAAAKPKLIDSGQYNYYSQLTKSNSKMVWKTYQYNKKYILVKIKFYDNKTLTQTDSMSIKKISSKKIKLIYTSKIYSGKYTITESKKYRYSYSKSIKKFYFKRIKPDFRVIT